MMSVTLPMVEPMVGANSPGSNSGVGDSSVKEQNAFMEEDFALTECDVLTEVVEGVPSITLSDRVPKFQDKNDYNKALVAGSWVIFGRYLTIRPWSPNFSTTQSGGYYSNFLFKAIGQKFISAFAQLAACVDLKKPLMSNYGLYGHIADLCSEDKTTTPKVESDCYRPVMDKSSLERKVEEVPFGSWMVVE
ncbi:hypothetical protein E1A91_D08G154800v1 [Gossypium mustelinum]|uniref:DUF4283 domain-containing protein n=1 Tax=Gossypium mustelinum TaxID=34275 RepID=A0A5D2TXR8_GOSMU|nr:hypothetical protein E1A91_D08G154600v1 [Gossypium mustelinum]TYI69427.1 hypothetical protein E1A91_D08G154800v1 [Gossypium mustelinum]